MDEEKAATAAAVARARQDPRYLSRAPEKVRNDREVVLTAVTCNGSALEHASTELQADKEVVLTAVTNQKVRQLRHHFGHFSCSSQLDAT